MNPKHFAESRADSDVPTLPNGKPARGSFQLRNLLG